MRAAINNVDATKRKLIKHTQTHIHTHKHTHGRSTLHTDTRVGRLLRRLVVSLLVVGTHAKHCATIGEKGEVQWKGEIFDQQPHARDTGSTPRKRNR